MRHPWEERYPFNLRTLSSVRDIWSHLDQHHPHSELSEQKAGKHVVLDEAETLVTHPVLPRPRVPRLTARPLSVVFGSSQLAEASLLCPFPYRMSFFLHDAPLCLLNKLSQISPQGDAAHALATQSAGSPGQQQQHRPAASQRSALPGLTADSADQNPHCNEIPRRRVEHLKAQGLRDDATYRSPLSSEFDFSHY